MRPGSKLQRRVVELSSKLPDLTDDQFKWAKEKVLEHKAFKLKNGRTGCLDCGHIWHDKDLTIKKVVCPLCGVKLDVEITRELKKKQVKWIAVIDTLEEFQLNRFWEITSHHRVGQPASFHHLKITEHWIIPGGKWEVMGRTRAAFNSYYSNFTGDFTLRHRNSIHRDFAINPWGIYPKIKVHSIYKRNGFKNSFHSADPFNLFKSLLDDPHVETLMKAGQYSLMRYRIYNHYSWNEFWPSIKIAIRNDYIIKNSKMWIDYLKLLKIFKKDLRNPKYILPQNIKKEHDILVAKEQEKRRRENEQRRIRQEQEEAEERKRKEEWDSKGYYETQLAPYLGLLFKDKDIEISLLKSIEDFKKEGEALNHCVHTNAYWAIPNRLCFSAKVNGKRTETIEFCLDRYDIKQCYGAYNHYSPYHDRIMKLMEKSINKIAKVHSSIIKASKKENSEITAAA